MQHRILVVAHDDVLRSTRSALLLSAGYAVSAVATGEEALHVLESEAFDVVLIGRSSVSPVMALDQRLRALHPHLRILKISQRFEAVSAHSTFTIDPNPVAVLAALNVMLGRTQRAEALLLPSQQRPN